MKGKKWFFDFGETPPQVPVDALRSESIFLRHRFFANAKGFPRVESLADYWRALRRTRIPQPSAARLLDEERGCDGPLCLRHCTIYSEVTTRVVPDEMGLMQVQLTP